MSQQSSSYFDNTAPTIREVLLIEQIKECWADNRNYDVILWAIPATITAIAGLAITAVFQLETSPSGAWARPLLALAAAVVTVPLVIALFKNRMFQIDRNRWRAALHVALANGTSPADEMNKIIINEKVNKVPETHPDLVTFSTARVSYVNSLGPWHWRLLCRRYHGLAAFQILFAVSILTLAAEVAMAFGFLLYGILQ